MDVTNVNVKKTFEVTDTLYGCPGCRTGVFKQYPKTYMCHDRHCMEIPLNAFRNANLRLWTMSIISKCFFRLFPLKLQCLAVTMTRWLQDWLSGCKVNLSHFWESIPKLPVYPRDDSTCWVSHHLEDASCRCPCSESCRLVNVSVTFWNDLSSFITQIDAKKIHFKRLLHFKFKCIILVGSWWIW